MTRALILKELREHAWVLAALLLLHAFTLAVLLLSGKDAGSVFVSFRSLTLSLGMLGVLVLNNRLIVREYTGRTQLFLETLPVTRARVLGVKWGLGLALALLPIALALLCCALIARGREPIGVRYLAILASRAGTFLFAAHALAFLAAMLGRYRFVYWAALGFGLGLLSDSKHFNASSLPLLRLVDEQMAFERHHFPWVDLLGVGLAALLCLAITFALGLSQEGGLAANLARKMSHREKVFFGGLALTLFVAEQTISDRRPRPLFELARAARASEGQTFVGIATSNEQDPAEASGEIGAALAGDLESLRLWLGMTEMPPVFVVPDSSLDPETFIRARLSDTDGVVLKAPLASPTLDRLAFRAFALQEVLSWYTRDRSRREPMAWFSSGLAQWWVRRGKPDDLLALRAAAASAGVLTPPALRDWLTTRERLGPCLADALETQLVTEISDRDGADRFQALARAAVGGARPADDVRATLTRHSFEQLLSAGSTLRLDTLAAALEQRLAADRLRLAAPLAGLKRLQAGLKLEPVGNGSGFEVFHQVDPVPASAEPVDYTVRYTPLWPWTGALTPGLLPRFDTRGKGVLPLVFPRGTQLFWAFEVYQPVLGCNVRFASQRQVLQ